MPRKAISPLAYIEAWKTQSYVAIHEAAKAEASRQVNEMVKWMDWQIQFDPDMMKEVHLKDGIFDLVRKSRNYRSTIYNRNKSIAEAEFEAKRAQITGDVKGLKEIQEKTARMEDDQWNACRRILKVYCHVKYKAGGSLELTEPEEIEYEYNPGD
jgi:hypothetical protein